MSDAVQVKKLNSELDASCPALKTRVDDLDQSNALVTRTSSATAAPPAAADETSSSVAGNIVDESMAEAAALVHSLFLKQMGMPQSAGDGAAAASAVPAADGAAAGDGAKEGGSPSKMALFVDDEILMQMSTKLTAMFIAIQRCAVCLISFSPLGPVPRV